MAMNDALTENKEFSTDAPAEFEYIKMDYKLKTAPYFHNGNHNTPSSPTSPSSRHPRPT